MTKPDPTTPLAMALGRVPSGLYVLTTPAPGGPAGFLASFVQQVGFEPPTVCASFAKERGLLGLVRDAGHFTLSVLGEGDRGLMKPFFKEPPEGVSPFEGLATGCTPSGGTFLADALAWLDCRVAGEHDAGDHVVVFGVVEGGETLREGDPTVHFRRNGLRY